MTKKELKQIEEHKRMMRNQRYMLVDAYTNFHGDLDAYERVNKINGEEMTDEIRQRVLDRYPILKEYGYTINRHDKFDDYVRAAIYNIVQTERKYKKYNCYDKFEKGIGENDLVYDETFPDVFKSVIMVKYAKMFGFERLIYAKHYLDPLCDFIEMGCKVVDTNRKNGEYGLTLDITDTNLSMFICHHAEKEKKELIKHNAEWGKETPQKELDDIDELHKTLIELVEKSV